MPNALSSTLRTPSALHLSRVPLPPRGELPGRHLAPRPAGAGEPLTAAHFHTIRTPVALLQIPTPTSLTHGPTPYPYRSRPPAHELKSYLDPNPSPVTLKPQLKTLGP
jgi:hypothetical protein